MVNTTESQKTRALSVVRNRLNESIAGAKYHANNGVMFAKAAKAFASNPNGNFVTEFNDGRKLVGNKDHAIDSAKRSVGAFGTAAKEAIKDKRVQAGAAVAAGVIAAKKLHDAKKVGKASIETDDTK